MLLDETLSLFWQKGTLTPCQMLILKRSFEEMKRLCPTVYDIVFSMLEMDTGTENKIPTMALVYSLTMFKRFREMSLLQRLNTLLLIDGDASQEVIKYNSCQRSRFC